MRIIAEHRLSHLFFCFCVMVATSCGSTKEHTAESAVTSTSSSIIASVADPTTTSLATTKAPTTTTTTTGAAGPRSSERTETTSISFAGALGGQAIDDQQVVRLRIESRVSDLSSDGFEQDVLAVLNDERGWIGAGFSFISDVNSPFQVILAEGAEVDVLCLPLKTHGTVSCQNGPIVALNATRWREGVVHWDAALTDYRGYLVNHEVGHLLGQRHPKPRCVVPGRPAGVMEQQTGGLEGCIGNAWPRPWEIELAQARPVVYAPLPDWGPDPVPTNGER